MNHILAIDQGTTSTRAVVFDEAGRSRGSAARELKQYYPQHGWVEHDAEEIWQAVTRVVLEALQTAGIEASQLAGIGLTNQRETVVLWDRASNLPLAHALVWQDRRTSDFCRQRKQDEDWIRQRTGLVLDPYFSATKIRWLLDHEAGLRARAESGKLAAGTIDSFLLWRLGAGRTFATDFSNASRTLLLDIHKATWDEELCRYFAVPQSLLPEVRPSAADFGTTQGLNFLPDGLPIAGIAGDQQSALFGQGGFSAGSAKCTYGTGAFFLQHTGEHLIHSKHRLLTSLAAMVDERRQYVLEGSVFVAGAAVQWLRDGLHLLAKAAEVESLAAASDPDQPILFVPAFVGLGAPHWVPEARGVMFGLTRNTTGKELARAALEGVAFQVSDLLEAAAKDSAQPLQSLRVDGGMAENTWFLQTQADLLGLTVSTAADSEATAHGAAFLAGLKLGLWKDLNALSRLIQPGRRFVPHLSAEERRRRLDRWHRAVKTVIDFYS
jgi:glycerol kinase